MLGAVEDEVSVKSTAGGVPGRDVAVVVLGDPSRPRPDGSSGQQAGGTSAVVSARADHGGERRGPGLVTALGRDAPRAGEPAHETLHGEKRRGSRRRAARAVSIPGWGRGGVHRVHGRAEKYQGQEPRTKGASAALQF